MDTHFLTVIIVAASIMVTPFFMLAVYVFSGAFGRQGLQVGTAFLIWGALMVWVCLNQVPAKLEVFGSLIVPLAWTMPVVILYCYRDWFLSHELSLLTYVKYQHRLRKGEA